MLKVFVFVNYGNNLFKKQKNGGVSFFRLPIDEKLKKKWLINIRNENLQKQPPMCSLKIGVLQNYHKIHRKTTVLESLLYKVAVIAALHPFHRSPNLAPITNLEKGEIIEK